MTENATPSGEVARGQPYYEKLRKETRATLAKKRAVDQQLAMLEEQLYRHETQYLEDTPHGNIIKGFDSYIKGTSSGAGLGGTAAARKKNVILDSERIFSRSSASFMRESSPDSLSQPSHAPTPTGGTSGAPTPTSTTGGAGNKSGSLKRTKKGDKGDEDDEGKAPKRLKMTFARADKD